MHVRQQLSASVNGVGEGGEGSVLAGQQSSSVVSVMELVKGGREVCVWVHSHLWCQ